MRVKPAGTSLPSNLALNVYYDSAEHEFSPHAYLGLYTQKSVRAISKAIEIIVMDTRCGQLEFTVATGTRTEDKKRGR